MTPPPITTTFASSWWFAISLTAYGAGPSTQQATVEPGGVAMSLDAAKTPIHGVGKKTNVIRLQA